MHADTVEQGGPEHDVPEYDVVVVGGGPAGATAATDLARGGRRVLLLERGFRIKPCGGAIPPRAVDQFEIPAHQIVARINSARMISPADQRVDMPVGDTYVAMVDRDRFDPFLRERAVEAGATLQLGAFKSLSYGDDGRIRVDYLDKSGSGGELRSVVARAVIGADGAKSRVGAQCVPGADKLKCVFAYHEIVEAPKGDSDADYKGQSLRRLVPGAPVLRIFTPGYFLTATMRVSARAARARTTRPPMRWPPCARMWGWIRPGPFAGKARPYP